MFNFNVNLKNILKTFDVFNNLKQCLLQAKVVLYNKSLLIVSYLLLYITFRSCFVFSKFHINFVTLLYNQNIY